MTDYTINLECPICLGLLIFLGLLGDLAWYRCRDCGMEFSHQVTRPVGEEHDHDES